MILGAVVTAMAAMATVSANAAFEDARPYVAADYTYLSGVGEQTGDLTDDYTNLLGVTGGIQFTDNIGVEVSWAHSVKDLSRFDDLDISYSQATVGVTGQYPIAEKVYAKGLLGGVWQAYDLEVDGMKATAREDAKFLGKVGVGYQIDGNAVVEFTYNRVNELDGLGIQYKYVF